MLSWVTGHRFSRVLTTDHVRPRDQPARLLILAEGAIFWHHYGSLDGQPTQPVRGLTPRAAKR